MEFSIGVDWLSLAGRVQRTEGDISPVGYAGLVEYALELARALEGRIPTLKTVRPAKYYQAAFQSKETGVVYHLSVQLQSQGWLAVASGKSARDAWNSGNLSAFIEVYKARVTRFDLAVDLFDSGISPLMEHDAFIIEHGPDSEFKEALHTGGEQGGYVRGDRQSERYYRLYDKAREQGLDIDWQRSEMEYKGDLAQWAYETYQDDPMMLVADTQRYLRTPESPLCTLLREVGLGGAVKRLKRAPAYHDREKWLAGQVLTSFISMAQEDPEAALRVFTLFAEEARHHELFELVKQSLDTV